MMCRSGRRRVAMPKETEELSMPEHKIKITCDSICDLPREVYREYDVSVTPLGIVLGDDLRFDGVNISTLEVFDYVDKNGVLPKTTAASVSDYLELFKKCTADGSAVIHINISSEFSSCHSSACIAAEQLHEKDGSEIYAIDSRNLSSGAGHLVLLAHELAAGGMSAPEIADALNEAKNRLDVSFVLQTLSYLQKGGRCPGVVAFGANLLKLRPEIEVKDGKMTVGKKYRGSMEKSIFDYVRGRLEGRTDIDLHRIFVTHSYVPDELVSKVVELVKELQPFEEVMVSTAGCAISSHCGPNCIGVLFFRKK